MQGWPNQEVRRQYREAEANASKLVQSNPDEGVKAREALLAWSTRLFGPDHDETAVAHHNLAYAYQKAHRYDLAEPHFRRAYEAHLKNYGRLHKNTGLSLMALGSCLSDLGQYAQAEAAYTAARRIFAETRDAASLSMANFNLALLYQNQKKYADALKLFLEEYNYRLRTLAPTHWSIARIEHQIGQLYWLMGRFADGERMTRSAIAISVQRQGRPTPRISARSRSTSPASGNTMRRGKRRRRFTARWVRRDHGNCDPRSAPTPSASWD